MPIPCSLRKDDIGSRIAEAARKARTDPTYPGRIARARFNAIAHNERALREEAENAALLRGRVFDG